MKLKGGSVQGNVMQFTMGDCSEAFANAIRRNVIDEVPTLAVEEVEFKDNTSALYDEMIAHRLGMVPIVTDLSSYELPKTAEEVAERSAKSTLKLTLKSSKKGVVLSGEAQSADPKCTAVAVMGQGKVHAKWSPGLVFYRHEPQFSFDEKKLDEEGKAMLLKAAPKGTVEDKGGKLKVDSDALLASGRFDAVLAVMQQAGMSVTDGDDLMITVEAWGQLKPKVMLEQAADIMVAQLDDFAQSL